MLASLNVGEIKDLDLIEQLEFDEFGVIHSCFHFVMFFYSTIEDFDYVPNTSCGILESNGR